MAHVRVPSPMRSAVGGRTSVEVRGATLRAVLHDLAAQFPAVRERLLQPDGSLQPHLMIVVDGAEAEGLFTPITAESEIVIVPAIGGGAIGDGIGRPLITGP